MLRYRRRSRLFLALLIVLWTRSLAMAEKAQDTSGEAPTWEDRRAAAVQAVIHDLEPLSPAVRAYDRFLSGLDQTHIASIVSAVDAYAERFREASQADRDRAFVLFFFFYRDTADTSKELECAGLDEDADHIPKLRALAARAGLVVFDDCAYNFWGLDDTFLARTFEPFISPSLVEFTKLEAMDLRLGFMNDNSLVPKIWDLARRCVCWEHYVHGFPNSLVRCVALDRYRRDLRALLRDAGDCTPGPYELYKDVASTKLDKEYLGVYQRVIREYPDSPLAATLRAYLDLLGKSDTIEKTKREAFFTEHGLVIEEDWPALGVMNCESCGPAYSWDEVQRTCLGYKRPAFGVVDTHTGQHTRVGYSRDGVPFPGDTYQEEYVFPCVWDDKTVHTLVEAGMAPRSPFVANPGLPQVVWKVREFDGKARLLGTDTVSASIGSEGLRMRYYYYLRDEKRIIGRRGDVPHATIYDGLIVGGPTKDALAFQRHASQSQPGCVYVKDLRGGSSRVLFEHEYLAQASVSSDMRYVAWICQTLSPKGPNELRLFDVAKKEDKLLTGLLSRLSSELPAWSPDGKIMAYSPDGSSDRGEILFYSVESGESRKLVPDVCRQIGVLRTLVFLDSDRLVCHYYPRNQSDDRWVAMDIATGKTLWTLRDRMEHVTVFDCGRKIACYFPEAKR